MRSNCLSQAAVDTADKDDNNTFERSNANENTNTHHNYNNNNQIVRSSKRMRLGRRINSDDDNDVHVPAAASTSNDLGAQSAQSFSSVNLAAAAADSANFITSSNSNQTNETRSSQQQQQLFQPSSSSLQHVVDKATVDASASHAALRRSASAAASRLNADYNDFDGAYRIPTSSGLKRRVLKQYDNPNIIQMKGNIFDFSIDKFKANVSSTSISMWSSQTCF